MKIIAASPTDLNVLVGMAALLWPYEPEIELASGFDELLRDPECALFIAADGAEAVGFAQCQLRRDYVEGTATCPVGYLEGLYVRADARRSGVATQLVRACEDWAADQGCTEFASDCELDNADSIAFHRAAGFTEAARVVCFVKGIGV